MNSSAVAWFALGVLAGLVTGAVGVLAIVAHVERRAVRYARTGSPDVVPRSRTVVPGSEFTGPVKRSAEVAIEREAEDEAFARIVRRGADELMSMNPGLTLEQAAHEAETALAATGAFRRSG